MRYAVIDEAGLVDNVIVWNGDTWWRPPDGFTAVEIGDEPVSVGDTLHPDGSVTPAPPPAADQYDDLRGRLAAGDDPAAVLAELLDRLEPPA